MALCLPWVADQGIRHLFQIAEFRRDTSDPDGDIRNKPLSQGVEWLFQSPCAGDHDLAFWHLPQSILQSGHAAEVLRLMAMLGVQDPIKIKKQDGHVLAF